VARHHGYVLLVPLTAPGDRVRVRVLEARPGYATARLEQILEPSPHRVEPRCRHFAECGGCAYQHIAPGPQTEAKAAQVREALRRIGRLGEPPVLEPFHPPSPYAYRTRIDLTVVRDPRGVSRLGYHRRGAGSALPIDECAIAAPPLEALRAHLDRLLGPLQIEPFDTRARRGLLRRVVLRSCSGGDTLVELRAARAGTPAVERLASALAGWPGLLGVTEAEDRGGRRSLTGPARLLWGRNCLEEEIGGMRIEFPAGSFVQTHGPMIERLYGEALRALGPVPGRACLDLFCGAGPLSLLLARAGAREVLGIEAEKSSAEAASANARRAGITVCRFAQAQVEAALAGPLAPWSGGRFELLVANPPRAGLSRAALEGIVLAAPERMAYVSCDPATLARDLRLLGEAGLRLEWARPIDLFPQTAHVETVAALSGPER
jgi:23S rRNA (uracil1939-C5)-methyltransferase